MLSQTPIAGSKEPLCDEEKMNGKGKGITQENGKERRERIENTPEQIPGCGLQSSSSVLYLLDHFRPYKQRARKGLP